MPPFSTHYKYKINVQAARKLAAAKILIEIENPTAVFMGYKSANDVHAIDVRGAEFFYPSQVSTSILEMANGPGFAHYYAPKLPFNSPFYSWTRVYSRYDLIQAEKLILKITSPQLNPT